MNGGVAMSSHEIRHQALTNNASGQLNSLAFTARAPTKNWLGFSNRKGVIADGAGGEMMLSVKPVKTVNFLSRMNFNDRFMSNILV